MLKKIKDILYYYFAEKNWGVRREYGPYVDAHQQEHKKSPWKHWWLLIQLNWHYRILRKKTLLIKTPFSNLKSTQISINESTCSKRKDVLTVAKELLNYDIISFDVFDTLVFRSLQNPADMFVLLEEKHKIFNFAILRKQAEEEARQECEINYGHRDVSIYDIYKRIETKSGLDMEYGIEAELEMELELCFPNEYMKTIYDIVLGQGKKVIITSDMYLPAALLGRILNKCGYFEDDYYKLYVSCDYGKSKRSGELYQLISNELGKDLEYCHVGDNPISDIESAKAYGWNVHYYRNVNSIGKPFRPKNMSPLVGSAYAGIINTHLHESEKIYSKQYQFGFIYGGIYALGYVNWIHNYLLSHNQQKVIFLARDSDILKDIYDTIYSDIPSEYLYWGRLPSFKYSLSMDRFAFFQRNINDRVNRKSQISINKLFKLLDLEWLISQLSQYGLNQDDLLCQENMSLVEKLIAENLYKIEEKYEKEKQFGKIYVKSVIGEAQNVTIVDIGWKGTEPQTLKRLIECEWKLNVNVSCLMAGSYGNSWNVQDGTFSVYMFSPLHNLNHMNFLKKNISYYTLIVELFGRMHCEPRFQGFFMHENKVCMKFENMLVENINDMKEIQQGMMDFVNLYKQKFSFLPFMMNISGADAYCPTRLIERKYKYLEKVFAKHLIELDAGDNFNGFRTISQYIKDNKI